MKLASFGISNFKAFGHKLQRLPIKPITLVFGPNSAGKSSLLQSLFWTLNSASNGDLENRAVEAASGTVDLGGFRSMLHRHERERRVQVEVSIDTGADSPPVRIIHQLGFASNEDYQRMQKLLIAESPLFQEYREQHAICRKVGSLFDMLFNFQVPPQEQIEALLDDPEALEAQIAEASQQMEELGYVPFHGNPPNQETLQQAFALATTAWSRIAELSSHKDQIEKHGQYIQRTLEQEEHNASLLAVEVILGGEIALKAVRLPGKKTLECQILDEAVIRQLPDAEDSWIESVPMYANGKKVGTTLYDGYEITVPETSVFENLSIETIAKAFSWLRVSKQTARTLQTNLIYLGPLRHLPSRKELVGVLGEQTRNPAVLPWIRLRDDREIQHAVNRSLAALQSRPYQFQTKIYAAPQDTLNAKDSFDVILRTSVNEECPMWLDAREELLGNSEEHPSFEDLLSENEVEAYRKLDEKLSESHGSSVLIDLALQDLSHGVTVSLCDVGVGISQLAPILVHATASKNKQIVIEQPEIHVHPKLQAELADVFIESALGENQNSFLIETHSEHLILRLLRRIRETTEGEISDWPENLRQACPDGIRPEDIAVLYVQPGEEGAEIVELPVTPDGDFSEPWPDGFFAERSKELF